MIMNAEPANKFRRTFYRDFLSKTVDHAARTREEFLGRPQMRLSDLGQIPDRVMRGVTPVFSAGMAHELSGSTLCIRDRASGKVLESVRLSQVDAKILGLFERGLTLQQVVEGLDCLGGQEAVEAYLRVKTLFLSLARCGVCHPAESLADVSVEEH